MKRKRNIFNRNLNYSIFLYYEKILTIQKKISYENGLNNGERGHSRKAQWEREQSEQEVNLEAVWPLLRFLCTLKEDLNVAGVQMPALDRGITSAISCNPYLTLTFFTNYKLSHQQTTAKASCKISS